MGIEPTASASDSLPQSRGATKGWLDGALSTELRDVSLRNDKCKIVTDASRTNSLDKILEFETDPQDGMKALEYNLRRALRIEPARMDKMVELDNAEREETRLRTGRKKPGPKPRSVPKDGL